MSLGTSSSFLKTCNNCGKHGHHFYQCKQSITSLGLIVFRMHPETKVREYLMIRRKDSFGFIDFVRGKYQPKDAHQLQTIIDQMSSDEKQRLRDCTFDELWTGMWGDAIAWASPQERQNSEKKYEAIRSKLPSWLDQSSTNWKETEWEFPKGRRNNKERELDCALREFEEETGIPLQKIQVLDNVCPYEENYIGTNLKSYKHKYFVAQMSYEADFNVDHTIQLSEVSKASWMSLPICLDAIRPYHWEKRQLLQLLDHALNSFHILSLSSGDK